jgi:hypothetical protein
MGSCEGSHRRNGASRGSCSSPRGGGDAREVRDRANIGNLTEFVHTAQSDEVDKWLAAWTAKAHHEVGRRADRNRSAGKRVDRPVARKPACCGRANSRCRDVADARDPRVFAMPNGNAADGNGHATTEVSVGARGRPPQHKLGSREICEVRAGRRRSYYEALRADLVVNRIEIERS